MPLAFESISHGTIAFGFFNIESDMLLLDRYFLFSTDFCRYMEAISEWNAGKSQEMNWQGYEIPDAEKVGDLMGAIHGYHFTGFLGDVYRKFPFPQKEEGFKQKPEGTQTQDTMKSIIKPYGAPVEMPFVQNDSQTEAAIGRYRFSRASFQALIRYVWQGGYPRWRDEQRPDYVISMKEKIAKSKNPLFEGLELSF